MNKRKHLGVYGLIIKNNNIVLINKVGGPYDGKLDLPGGSIEYGEKIDDALKRELKEEVGIDITRYSLFDVDSVYFEWVNKNGVESCHHIGIFYKIFLYENEVQENINIDEKNDDSKGAKYYEIDKLEKNNLSQIAILELQKLGYKIK